MSLLFNMLSAATATAKSHQMYPTLCDRIDSNPPGSPVPGILQQEHWSGLPLPSPMHESEKWKGSCSVMSDSATSWTAAYQAPLSIGFSRQEYWSGVSLTSLNMLSRLVIIFLPRCKHLLISWLQSPSAVILRPPQSKSCHCFCSIYTDMYSWGLCLFLIQSFLPLTFFYAGITFKLYLTIVITHHMPYTLKNLLLN